MINFLMIMLKILNFYSIMILLKELYARNNINIILFFLTKIYLDIYLSIIYLAKWFKQFIIVLAYKQIKINLLIWMIGLALLM